MFVIMSNEDLGEIYLFIYTKVDQSEDSVGPTGDRRRHDKEF